MDGKEKNQPTCPQAVSPAEPLWQLLAMGSSIRPRWTGAWEPPLSIVGSISHHWTALWLSGVAAFVYVAVPAGCGTVAIMMVCAVQRLPLRRTAFCRRESLAMWRLP